jgi:hypothetical protein
MQHDYNVVSLKCRTETHKICESATTATTTMSRDATIFQPQTPSSNCLILHTTELLCYLDITERVQQVI